MAKRENNPWRKLYDTARWKRLRIAQLNDEPLCERCRLSETIEPATVVHHRKAHKGDPALFFDIGNLESLCKPHHDREGRLEDLGKKVIRFDETGWPID